MSTLLNLRTNTAPDCPVCNEAGQYDFTGRDLMFGHYEPYDYYRCTQCGAVFQAPMPDIATIATFYPTDYSIYDEHGRFRKLSALRRAILRRTRGYHHLQSTWLASAVALFAAPLMPADTPLFVPGGRLLDVGCGNGRFLLTMQSLGWEVQGVEFNDEGVRVCRQTNLAVHHGDVASASFPDASFDLITVRHVIEHIPDPHTFTRELVRILKPGGLLIEETPNIDALGRAWLGPIWFANEVPRHLILFSTSSLKKLAEKYGLTSESVTITTSPKILLNSIDYIIENKDIPSRKVFWRRLLSRIYIYFAQRTGRGDIIHAAFRKPLSHA